MAPSDDEIKTVHSGRSTHSNNLPPSNEIERYLEPGREGTLGRLGHYDVLEVIGEGGFGIVVKAFDQTLERLVAIKILSPRLTTTSPPRQFFLREARTAAKVRHEHVVAIHNVEEEPLPFLVMEYIEGETLQDRLDRVGPLEQSEAVEIGRQIALGLAAAHATGLIHRDVKPGNIMLEKGDTPCVKITDFGIARTADDASLSQSGFVVGTPMYMSPEQAEGISLDHRADLFSLGSVLYTMVSGRPPFRAETSMAVLKRVCDETPRPIQQVNPDVGAGLCAIIAKLHAKSPTDRYGSALELVEALDDCLYEKPTSRRSPSRLLLGLVALALLAVGIGLIASGFTSQNQAAPQAVPTTAQSPTPKTVPLAERLANPWEETEWEKAVAEMPVGDRVPAVYAKLQALNPKFDPRDSSYEIKEGVVDTLLLTSSYLTNLTPLRALKGLRSLRIETGWENGVMVQNQLVDLSPLRGMNLEELYVQNNSVKDLSPVRDLPLKVLSIWGFAGNDLSPLQGMQLTHLNAGACRIHDLSPLRGMPLTFLCVNRSDVHDLAPLVGMPLKELFVEHTKVTDLSALAGMPLEHLTLEGSPIREQDLRTLRTLPVKNLLFDFDKSRDLDLLRSLETLEIVNNKPVVEFLAKAEATPMD